MGLGLIMRFNEIDHPHVEHLVQNYDVSIASALDIITVLLQDLDLLSVSLRATVEIR